nr:zinc finger, CCHC-type [Tanacetum cinerariifolium]
KFDEVVLSNGYLLNQADKCVYSKFDEYGILVIKIFDEGHGEANVIPGIRIKHKSNGIAISQSHYIKKVLKKFNYFDYTPVSTLMDASEKLMPNNGQAISQLEYFRVIGCLMYAMTCIKPDITFVMAKLSRYTRNPGTQHWQAVQKVLKYLKKTMDYRLMYTGYPSMLEGYTDVSWIINTRQFFYKWLAVGKEAEWLKNLLLEISLWVKPIAPIYIRCDSAATLAKAYSQMYNGKFRHLGVRHSMILELITNGVVSIEFLKAFKGERMKSKDTLYLLFQSVDESGFENIVGASTAKEAWDMLEKACKGVDRVKQVLWKHMSKEKKEQEEARVH